MKVSFLLQYSCVFKIGAMEPVLSAQQKNSTFYSYSYIKYNII